MQDVFTESSFLDLLKAAQLVPHEQLVLAPLQLEKSRSVHILVAVFCRVQPFDVRVYAA
jgi:hypothetical protein